jgi:hypothetical protein
VKEVTLELSLNVYPPLSRETADFTARGKVRNHGAVPVAVNWTLLTAPSLALEIRDSRRQSVRLPPPPVPGSPADFDFGTVLPGQILPVEWHRFLPDWAMPGIYQVRFRCFAAPREDGRNPSPAPSSPVMSEWVEFELAPAR